VQRKRTLKRSSAISVSHKSRRNTSGGLCRWTPTLRLYECQHSVANLVTDPSDLLQRFFFGIFEWPIVALPVGRALTPAEQKRLFEAGASNPEWEHVESATGKGVLYVTRSKNETSKRPIPLNQAAREAVERMLKRADALGHTDPEHYVWCASQHHKHDPRKPARKWDGAWRSLRKAAGLPGFRFHDLRHTVDTDLLEAGEPDHVIQAVTGQLSKKMLEHDSHQRLKAKGQMLTRMEERRKKKESA
jgi:hypothetical protein